MYAVFDGPQQQQPSGKVVVGLNHGGNELHECKLHGSKKEINGYETLKTLHALDTL